MMMSRLSLLPGRRSDKPYQGVAAPLSLFCLLKAKKGKRKKKQKNKEVVPSGGPLCHLT